ncbi:MAG: UDP-3-O-acylglucosamine N-acyltransferase [Chitinophagales bacterium]|nr:MAG: UDP-3-O-acylglucosamine N-acyltransferase [Chitinophagales bacterium]
MSLTVQEICDLLNGRLEGDGSRLIEAPARIEEATPYQISFIGHPKYEQFAATSQAGALIVAPNFKIPSGAQSAFIRVDDPYEAFRRVLELFSSGLAAVRTKSGIEQPAWISNTAKLGNRVYVGAFSYVGDKVVIGHRVKIFPGVFVGDNVMIGDDTIVYAGVKIYSGCVIGQHCIIHAGAVIGSDGFGFVPGKDGSFTKIPQTGNVVIEDHVEIGANTTIDRATVGSTIIRKGVKLDNLIQIGHNVEIGQHSAMAAQSGVSGSTKIGKNCLIAGQVGFAGHLKIADCTRIGAKSGVSNSVSTPGGTWQGIPLMEHRQSLKAHVIYRNLPELEKRVSRLEKRLQELSSDD